jgi:hypothetical protein
MNENEISKILVDSAIEEQVPGKRLNAKTRGCKDAKTMTI